MKFQAPTLKFIEFHADLPHRHALGKGIPPSAAAAPLVSAMPAPVCVASSRPPRRRSSVPDTPGSGSRYVTTEPRWHAVGVAVALDPVLWGEDLAGLTGWIWLISAVWAEPGTFFVLLFPDLSDVKGWLPQKWTWGPHNQLLQKKWLIQAAIHMLDGLSLVICVCVIYLA